MNADKANQDLPAKLGIPMPRTTGGRTCRTSAAWATQYTNKSATAESIMKLYKNKTRPAIGGPPNVSGAEPTVERRNPAPNSEAALPRLAYSMCETAQILGVSYITVH